MAKVHFTDEFKWDAMAQIVERGYSAAEVSNRLGVSQHSLYGRKKKCSGPKGAVEDNRDVEIRQLKRELAQVTEERDILNRCRIINRSCELISRRMATAYFAKDGK
jgi:transposase